MKLFIALLICVPWSLVIGFIALVWKRLKQRQVPTPSEEGQVLSYESSKFGWQVVDADYIAKIGRA